MDIVTIRSWAPRPFARGYCDPSLVDTVILRTYRPFARGYRDHSLVDIVTLRLWIPRPFARGYCDPSLVDTVILCSWIPWPFARGYRDPWIPRPFDRGYRGHSLVDIATLRSWAPRPFARGYSVLRFRMKIIPSKTSMLWTAPPPNKCFFLPLLCVASPNHAFATIFFKYGAIYLDWPCCRTQIKKSSSALRPAACSYFLDWPCCRTRIKNWSPILQPAACSAPIALFTAHPPTAAACPLPVDSDFD